MTEERRGNPGLWILAIFALALLILWNVFFDFGWSWRGRHWLGIPWFGPINSLFGIYWVISLGLAVWVGVDANRRGNNGWLWGGLTLVTGLVGLLVYLLLEKDVKIARRGIDDVPGAAAAPHGGSPGEAGPAGGARVVAGVEPEVDARPGSGPCEACGAEVRPEFKHCPYCGTSLERRCSRCGRDLERGWRACPDCGAPAETPGAVPPSPADPG